jgi:hypothetical protein
VAVNAIAFDSLGVLATNNIRRCSVASTEGTMPTGSWPAARRCVIDDTDDLNPAVRPR